MCASGLCFVLFSELLLLVSALLCACRAQCAALCWCIRAGRGHVRVPGECFEVDDTFYRSTRPAPEDERGGLRSKVRLAKPEPARLSRLSFTGVKRGRRAPILQVPSAIDVQLSAPASFVVQYREASTEIYSQRSSAQTSAFPGTWSHRRERF